MIIIIIRLYIDLFYTQITISDDNYYKSSSV